MLFDRKRWDKELPVVTPEAPKPKAKPKALWRRMLISAATYIQKHGWVQEQRRTPAGKVCILGALDALNGRCDHTVRCQAEARLHRAVAEARLHRAVGDIVAFNDSPSTTKAMVLAKLRSVAKGK